MTQTTIAALTKRERQVVALVAEGLKNKEIAGSLFMSPATVGHHFSSIFTKLEAVPFEVDCLRASERFG